MIMPRQITTILLGIIIGSLIHLYLLLSEGFVYQDLIATGIIAAMGIGILIAFMVRTISQLLDKTLSWRQNVGRRLVASVLVNTISACLIFYLFYYFFWDQLAVDIQEYPAFDRVSILRLSIIILVVVAIYSIIKYALFSFQTFAHTQINKTRLHRELIDIQMNTLKSQLRPHFLFNSLNTISSLIHDDAHLAEKFIRQLATTYNYTLNNYDKESVSLGEELNLVNAYIKMMKVRFGKGISFIIDVPDRFRIGKVLPLSIQTLIENALKHNTISEQLPLEINIKYLDGHIRVRNNKTTSPTNVESGRIGLTNLKRRLELWNNSKIEIQNNDQFYKVIIPVHEPTLQTI